MRDIRGIGFRLLQALNDPARRERSVALVLLTYAALWTLYGVIAKGGQDIHDDMAEQFVIGRDLALGYTKHPPLAVWIVRLWFAVLPVADWAYYLLAMANAAVALWLIWRLCGHFLDGDKRVLGLALLTLVPFFNFHALKFNANTVLLPLWAATTLAFLRSYETRRPLSAAAAGLCAALAMLGKYWSVFLLLGLGLAALADPRRKAYFCSAAPWITIASGAFAFAPHVLWLIQYEFAPFSYAAFVHGEASFRSALTSVVGYVAGGIGYVCLPLLVVLALVRPNLATLKDMAWPSMPKRRLAAAAFWATLALPALAAPLGGFRLTSLWTMSAWTLLPVVLLSSPLVVISREHVTRVVALTALFPLLALAAAPAVGVLTHRGERPADGHPSLLAQEAAKLWGETSEKPLRVFGSVVPFTYGTAFYLPDHPAAVHLLERPATAAEEENIAVHGAALLCPMTSLVCRQRLQALADRHPPGRRREAEVSRRYLGFEASPARYLMVTVPPRAPDPSTK